MAISLQMRLRGRDRSRERWTVTVRRDNHCVSATFPNKRDAEAWGGTTERAIIHATENDYPFDKAKHRRRGRRPTLKELHPVLAELDYAREPDTDPRPRVEWSLAKAFKHYLATITPRKKGADREANRINQWCNRPLGLKRLCDITPGDIQAHIDARLDAGRAGTTIRNEVFLISGLFAHATKLVPESIAAKPTHGWGLIALRNPVKHVELPPPRAHRNRRLQDADTDLGVAGEEARMRQALLDGPDGADMADLFTLAIETAMRLSELLSIRPSQLRLENGVRFILQPHSKNGHERRVVLSSRARDVVLRRARDAMAEDLLLFLLKVHTVENRWRAARKAANITGLTFHDLRHEGLSRMANRGLTVAELQGQGGQLTPAVLMRYLNAKVSEVSAKLD